MSSLLLAESLWADICIDTVTALENKAASNCIIALKLLTNSLTKDGCFPLGVSKCQN